jgi:hypothetical protein
MLMPYLFSKPVMWVLFLGVFSYMVVLQCTVYYGGQYLPSTPSYTTCEGSTKHIAFNGTKSQQQKLLDSGMNTFVDDDDYEPPPQTTEPSLLLSASPASSSDGHHVAYHQRPNDFVDVLADCLHSNSTCHIIYRHVGKTGGTGVQAFFWKLLGLPMRDTCCSARMRRRFMNNTRDYCAQAFQSYEVIDGFGTMVKVCDDRYYKKPSRDQMILSNFQDDPRQGWQPHRLIVLTTLREPIERLLSKIHQICNKNLKSRSQKVLAACQRCDFAQDEDMWMQWAREQGSLEDRVIVQQTRGPLHKYPHLWLDVSDLNAMIHQLRPRFSQQQQQEVFDWYFSQKHNPEKLNNCRFSMDSSLIKGLNESKAIYKDFLTGRLWEKYNSSKW